MIPNNASETKSFSMIHSTQLPYFDVNSIHDEHKSAVSNEGPNIEVRYGETASSGESPHTCSLGWDEGDRIFELVFILRLILRCPKAKVLSFRSLLPREYSCVDGARASEQQHNFYTRYTNVVESKRRQGPIQSSCGINDGATQKKT